MKKILLPLMVSGGVVFAAGQTYAADISINGFASIVGGMTLNEGDAYDGPATYVADITGEGTYDEDLSFKPDSIYGLQVRSDLGDGLSVVGMVTGVGGEDFQAEISWAYISYDLNDNWNAKLGRQRIPLFYYSDFLDVGYAYHWIRVPHLSQAAGGDTLDGINLTWQTSLGDWESQLQVYGGSGDEYLGEAGSDTHFRDILGVAYQVSNDWLTLRASYAGLDFYFDDPAASSFSDENGNLTSKDDPNHYTFLGFAANASFDDWFVMGEIVYAESDDVIGYGFDVLGFSEETSWYVSTGYRIGDFTPHITYTSAFTDRETQSVPNGMESGYEAVTLGLRWDFHPSAAFKVEYLTQTDESDSEYTDGPLIYYGGAGHGDSYDVDVVSFGVDVVF